MVTRCIERGINYIDACTHKEIQAYSKALKGRRDQMYLGWSWYEREARDKNQCNAKALIQVLDELRRRAPIDFTLVAVNVDSGYKDYKHDVIARACEQRGWELRIEHTSIGEVMDDILDAAASTATLGKTAGKDAAQNKPTYVSLLGIGEAKRMAAELRAEAHAALDGFGEAARRLHELTDYIVDRSF